MCELLPKKFSFFLILILGVGICLLSTQSCNRKSNDSVQLRLIYTSDVLGYLNPCG